MNGVRGVVLSRVALASLPVNGRGRTSIEVFSEVLWLILPKQVEVEIGELSEESFMLL